MMTRFNRYAIYMIVILVFQIPAVWSQVPEFDADQAFQYLEAQCAFGPRNPGSEGHKQCMAYLISEMQKYADTVREQPFLMSIPGSPRMISATNIIASFGQGSEPVLLCAHWDTRPWSDHDPEPSKRNNPVMGANDGASGVAVLLEVARILKKTPPTGPVDIVFFDGEDAGHSGQTDTWCLGSRVYAESLSDQGMLPRYAILLDMVGDRDLHLPMEGYSRRYVPNLVSRLWTKAGQLGLTAFENRIGPFMIDDHLELLKVGVPAVNIIDFDYPFWHTTEDTVDKCSPESLKQVGTLILYMIYE